MKSVIECILTADDRPYDKYPCNVCSAPLNIRPVNVVDMAYHYFLFFLPQQRSLPGSPAPDCHQPLPAPTISHLLTSSLRDEQTEEQPGRRFEGPANMLCIHINRTSTTTGLNTAFIPSNELGCLLLNVVQVKQMQHGI